MMQLKFLKNFSIYHYAIILLLAMCLPALPSLCLDHAIFVPIEPFNTICIYVTLFVFFVWIIRGYHLSVQNNFSFAHYGITALCIFFTGLGINALAFKLATDFFANTPIETPLVIDNIRCYKKPETIFPYTYWRGRWRKADDHEYPYTLGISLSDINSGHSYNIYFNSSLCKNTDAMNSSLTSFKGQPATLKGYTWLFGTQYNILIMPNGTVPLKSCNVSAKPDDVRTPATSTADFHVQTMINP